MSVSEKDVGKKDSQLEAVAKRRAEWEADSLAKFVAKRPERKQEFKTASGLTRKRLYTPLDVQHLDYNNDLGFPGEYPFTRGVYPTMYRGQTWTMRQIAGFGSGEDTNGRFRFLISQGQTGLSADFDFPTLVGYDSDHPRAFGEVGKVGVAIDSVPDMEALYDGLPLDEISVSMTINFPAPVLFAMFLVMAERRGYAWDKLAGTIQFDLLKEYVGQKSFIFPPRPSMKLIRDVFAFASKNTPRWNFINVSGYHTREAGSTAVQEVAFTLAAGVHYVKEGLAAGLTVDEFAPRISFFFGSFSDFFEEIAKFRAARRLWARLMKERFGAQKPESMRLRFHTQTAGCSCTAQQPLNNIIRTTVEGMAAILGGTQSLHCNGYDEALSIPTEHAMQIALRTQQILAEESGIGDVVDPMAGSYYVESLTSQIEQDALRYIDEIEARGGYIKCLEENYLQREVAESAYQWERGKETGDVVVVGVTKYAVDEELTMETFNVDEAMSRKQMDRTAALKKTRNSQKVEQHLARIRAAATGPENIMPILLDAVRDNVTKGEIIQALKDVYGEHKESPVF